MSTALGELYASLDIRLGEVDRLLALAETCSDAETVSALCRSAVVLIASHLEGYSRDVVGAVARDLSENVVFKSLPKAMRRTYATWFFEGEAKEGEAKQREIQIRRLVDVLEQTDVKIHSTPFLIERNRNTSPGVMERILGNIGIRAFFRRLDGSAFDDFFSGDRVAEDRLVAALSPYLDTALASFPYGIDLSAFAVPDVAASSGNAPKRTLWEEWLDALMTARHGVAHGRNLGNQYSVAEIRRLRRGAHVILMAFTSVVGSEMRPTADAF